MLFRKKIVLADPGVTGKYVCTNCGVALFEANKKFDAGCGFPSFWMHFDFNVQFNELKTYGKDRIQLICKNCGLHLGHLFQHEDVPGNLRYCINETSIVYVDEK